MKENGFGLIEIVVVTAIVTTALFAFLQAGTLAVRLLRAEKENLEAILLAQESVEAARLLRDESWSANIASLANAANYYPVFENGKWKLSSISPGLVNGKYTRLVILDEVRRDAQDKISSSGSVDTNTRKVTARVSWSTKQTELVTYIANFPASLSWPQETKTIFFEDATTDADLANFPSNNSGNGDPAQGFTTAGSIKVTKVELYLRRTTSAPSNIYAELRASPTGTILGTSNAITSSTVSTSSQAWVEFRFPDQVLLSASTKYYIRLRSAPSSTDAGSGSQGILNWGYAQSSGSPYGGHGNEARRYIGRLSNPNDTGQELDQYDFGFRIFALQ
ncbi:MAG: type II secretion system protein [Candidatus Sungbacteria bacterium]|nr:type II secretion system protein [Candidatus Sungbacteria bacterium]